MKLATLSLTLTLGLFGACSGDRGGTVGSESHWLPCAKSDDCESSYVCARGQCRPQDDEPWVDECDAAVEICNVPGSAPVRDPELGTGDWELGRGAVARPKQSGTCSVGANNYFGGAMQIEFGDTGKRLRSTPMGGTSAHEYEYGAGGFVTRVFEVPASPTSHETVYERDAVGRLMRKVESGPNGSREVSYQHDSLGRISRVDWTHSDGDTDGIDVAWSEDGLTHTDHTSPCPDRSTLTLDADGYVAGRDWPDCAAFGDPLTEYDHDDDRFVAHVSIDRDTGERREVLSAATYDSDGRVLSVSREPDFASETYDQSTITNVEWEGRWMKRLVVSRIHSGRLVETVEMTGDCWFTVDEIRNWMPHGTLIGP